VQALEHDWQWQRPQAILSKTQINLKLIPGVTDHPEICQLVAISLTDIVVKGSWIGPGPGSFGASSERARRGMPVHRTVRRPSLPYRSDAAQWTRRP
jgi:acetoacetate decarboxylase